jgi:hypothetical protein
MNIKDTIKFKTLREKGPSCINVKESEIVQIMSRENDVKYIIDSQHYIDLYMSKQEKRSLFDTVGFSNNINQLSNSIPNNNLIKNELDLTQNEILYFYDEPIIFTATDKNTHEKYFCNLVDSVSTNNYNEKIFLVNKIKTDFINLKEGVIDLKKYLSNQDLLKYSIRTESSGLVSITTTVLSFSDACNEKYIADDGFFLKEDLSLEIQKIKDFLLQTKNSELITSFEKINKTIIGKEK